MVGDKLIRSGGGVIVLILVDCSVSGESVRSSFFTCTMNAGTNFSVLGDSEGLPDTISTF